VVCPLCFNPDAVRIGRRSDFGDPRGYAPFVPEPMKFEREILRCSRCGLGFVWPAYGETEFADLYEQEGYYRFQALVSPVGTDVHSERSRELIASWEPEMEALGVLRWKAELNFSSRPRFLDVGCGLGRLMILFDRLGFDVVGIDSNEREVEFVRSTLAFRALRASLADFSAGEERFHCVMAAHILEHVTDPHAFIEQLRRLLLSGGLLVLETPLCNDYGRPEERYRDIYHTLFFDHFTLAFLALPHGFETVGFHNKHFFAEVDGSRCLFMQVALRKTEQPTCVTTDEGWKLRPAYDALMRDALAWSPSYLRALCASEGETPGASSYTAVQKPAGSVSRDVVGGGSRRSK
jgi:2-polyprenyl-3-methyl-5-hydroxy-6-metoxy-1,4-benzoquinol methylase